MQYTCAIIDDDLFSLDQVSEYIKLIPKLYLSRAYNDPLEAWKEISIVKKPYDFLFLDVEMPNLSGLEICKKIGDKVNNIILISGHLRYAIDGYEVNVKGFLHKPFNFEKFEELINGLTLNKISYTSFLPIKLGKKNSYSKVYINTIIAVEGNGNYIKIHTLNETLVTYNKLSIIEDLLSELSKFRRISKSIIISVDYIEKIDKYKVFLAKNFTFSVGESYRKDFNLFLPTLMFGH